MSPLVTPPEAVAVVRRKLEKRWAEAVCDRVVFTVPLRPGVATGRAVEQLGPATWA